MALKDTWVDKVDGVDINSAEDINMVAQAVIEIEKNGTGIGSSVEIVQTTGDSEAAVMSQKAVSELLYPFGHIVDKTETGTLIRVDRAVEGDFVEVGNIADGMFPLCKTNNNLFVPWSTIKADKSTTQNGVTLYYNEDGSYTLSGTSTAAITNLYMASFKDYKRCKAGTYMLTLNTPLPEGVSVQFAPYKMDKTTYFPTFSYKYEDGLAFPDGIVKYPFTCSEDFYFQARIKVDKAGRNVGNITLKPQLQPGTTLTEWQMPTRVDYSNGGEFSVKYTGEAMYLFADSDDELKVSYKWKMYSMKEMLELIRDTATDLYNRECDADEVDIDLDMSAIGGGQVETDVQTAMQTMVDMIPSLGGGGVTLYENHIYGDIYAPNGTSAGLSYIDFSCSFISKNEISRITTMYDLWTALNDIGTIACAGVTGETGNMVKHLVGFCVNEDLEYGAGKQIEVINAEDMGGKYIVEEDFPDIQLYVTVNSKQIS